MGVELHEGQRPMHRGCGPELGQRYGVVAAEDYGGCSGPVDRLQALLYAPVALLDVARDYGDVAVVYDREVVEDRYVEARVVAPEEVGGAANAFRAKTGPGPEGGARIERSAHHRGVGVFEVPNVRQAHKGAHVRKARGLERVSWLVTRQEAPRSGVRVFMLPDDLGGG